MTTRIIIPKESMDQFVDSCFQNAVTATLVSMDKDHYTYEIKYEFAHQLFYIGWAFGRDRWIECNKKHTNV